MVIRSYQIPLRGNSSTTIGGCRRDTYLNECEKQLEPVVRNLAARKAQYELLKIDLDMFSSHRPRVGIKFPDPLLQTTLDALIEDLRLNIRPLSLEQAEIDIEALRTKKSVLFNSFTPHLNHLQHLELNRRIQQREKEVLAQYAQRHKKKVEYYSQKQIEYTKILKLEKMIKDEQRLKKKEKKKRFTDRKKIEKQAGLDEKLARIKESGKIVNLSSIEIPDSIYLLLAKGNTFNPTKSIDKITIRKDTTEFQRKLAHAAYYYQLPEEEDEEEPNEPKPEENIPKDLRIKSNSWPLFTSKPLQEVQKKINTFVDGIQITKSKNNLTYLELTGLKLARSLVSSRKIYISQADKGGATLILDANVVHEAVLRELQNPIFYLQLQNDPMLQFQHTLRDISIEWRLENSMTAAERLAITGYTDVGQRKNKSLNPCHKVLKPYPVPNFKLHSLTNAQIIEKVLPPIRLISSSRNGPTYKLGKWVSGILTPISVTYCQDEYIRDSAHFLSKLDSFPFPKTQLEESGLCFTIDVNKLYPSLTEQLVLCALDDALSTSQLSFMRRALIKNATKLCLNNAFIHYRGIWVKSVLGIPTGGPESSALANIAMRWFLLQFKLSSHFSQRFVECLLFMWRFLDDIFGVWLGSAELLEEFVKSLNAFGEFYGLSFKYEYGKAVHFLDLEVDVTNGLPSTSIYIKPTDSPNLLNRGSFASPHIFKSLPFSQFRRAVVICSSEESRDSHLERIFKKLVDNGYHEEELQEAKERALALDRQSIIKQASSSIPIDNTTQPPITIITFVTTFNIHCKLFKSLFRDLEKDIHSLIGEHRIIVSEKRNPNIADLLFLKKRFTEAPSVDTRLIKFPCHKLCQGCPLMMTERLLVLDDVHEIRIKPKEGSCKLDNVIYIAKCLECGDFYIGHTINKLRDRCSGHRADFKDGLYHKSALSFHIFTDHPDKLSVGLKNFSFGVIAQCSPSSILDVENHYIIQLNADNLHLNRYKAVRFQQ